MYKKDCIPLSWSADSKLSQFQSDINKLNKELYKYHFVTVDQMKKTSVEGGRTKTIDNNTRGNKTRGKIKHGGSGNKHTTRKITV